MIYTCDYLAYLHTFSSSKAGVIHKLWHKNLSTIYATCTSFFFKFLISRCESNYSSKVSMYIIISNGWMNCCNSDWKNHEYIDALMDFCDLSAIYDTCGMLYLCFFQTISLPYATFTWKSFITVELGVGKCVYSIYEKEIIIYFKFSLFVSDYECKMQLQLWAILCNFSPHQLYQL